MSSSGQSAPSRGQPMGPRSRRVLRATLLVAAAVVAVAGTVPVAAQPAGETGLEVVGHLPEPVEKEGEITDARSVIAVTSDPDRLYYSYASTKDGGFRRFLLEYDASSTVPEFRRELEVGTTGEVGLKSTPFITTIDTTRNQMLLLSVVDAATRVVVVDLDRFEVVETWDLSTDLPGLAGMGITYDPGHDRMYLVGEMSGSPAVNSLVNAGRSMPAIAAVDPDSGARLWQRVVPECHRVLDAHLIGALITSSHHRPELSFFCRHVAGAPQVGESGLVQVQISPDATQADAIRFPVEFHPIAGTYAGPSQTSSGTGLAAFDPVSDRIFVQSRADDAPGAWVFDGRLDTWAGFLAARPTEFGNPDLNGFSPATGHFYMASRSSECPEPSGPCGYVTVVDGRATPLAAGTRVDDPDVRSYIVSDPERPRLFAQTAAGWVVVRDHIPPLEDLPDVDFDADTDDVPEGADTFTFHSAGTAGFGSQVTLVGGVESAGTTSEQVGTVKSLLAAVLGADRLEPLIDLLEGAGVDTTPPDPSFGNRQIALGAVGDAALGIAGSTATAQAVGRDQATVSDTEQVRRRAAVDDESLCQGDEDDEGQGADCEEAWPYALATCSDGTREPEQASSGDDAEVGNASVACDLEAEETVASARYGDLPIGDLVSVASSTTDTRLVRIPLEDPAGANAAVVETVAVAEGIELRAPDGAPDGAGGAVSIAEVRAVARAAAGGRTGTAEARWARTLQGVVVRDTSGEVVFGPASCVTIVDGSDDTGNGGREVNSCEQAISAINSVLQTRMQVELPTASVVATPKGAFAAVQQTDGDQLRDQATRDEPETETAVAALDIVIFNDRTEKSRLVVQLAGVRVNSIYQITQFPSSNTGIDTGSETPNDDATIGSSGPAPPPALPSTTSTTTTGAAPPTTSGSRVTGGPPEQAVSIDLAASQDDPQQPQVSPRQATSLPGRIGAGMRLLTRDPVQALLVGGVWLLFAGALTTLLRRLRLRQVVSS